MRNLLELVFPSPRPEKYCNTIPSIEIVKLARKWRDEAKGEVQ
jgi:hypothetical protein